MICLAFGSYVLATTGTYLAPLGISRSTELMGATTMNGILCLAASTAALYVPI